MNSPSDDSQASDSGGAVEAALRARLRNPTRQPLPRFVHSVPSQLPAAKSKESSAGSSRHGSDKPRKESSRDIGTEESGSLDTSLSDDGSSDEDGSSDTSSGDGQEPAAGAPSAVTLPGQTSRNRYFGADLARARLSQKCFNCGQTGHIRTECEFGLIPRPCGLCGGTAHLGRVCPVRRTLLERCDEERSMARRRSGYRRPSGVFAAVSVKGTHVICALCASPSHRTAVCPEADQLSLTTCLETGLKGMPRAASLSLDTAANPGLPSADAAKQQWTVAETIAFARKAAALPRHASAGLVGSAGGRIRGRASAWSIEPPQQRTLPAGAPAPARVKRRRSSSASSLEEGSVVSLDVDGDDDDDDDDSDGDERGHRHARKADKAGRAELQTHKSDARLERAQKGAESAPASQTDSAQAQEPSKRSKTSTSEAVIAGSLGVKATHDSVIVLDASPKAVHPSNSSRKSSADSSHTSSRKSSADSSQTTSSGSSNNGSHTTTTISSRSSGLSATQPIAPSDSPGLSLPLPTAGEIPDLASDAVAGVITSRTVTISKQSAAPSAQDSSQAGSAAPSATKLTAAALKKMSKKQRKERIKQELDTQFDMAKRAGLSDDAARAWNNGFWASSISNVSMMAGSSKAAKEVAINEAKLRRSKAQEEALAAGFANPIPLN